MPSSTDRTQLVSEELPEFPYVGPFGGIQSEMPLDRIEQMGFASVNNIMFRKAAATVRPSFTLLNNVGMAVNGIADFFDRDGIRHQVVMTGSDLWQWQGPVGDPNQWMRMPAIVGGVDALKGSVYNIYDWAVVNYKLLFCQGVDTIQLYDGISGFFGPASPNAVPARHMMELTSQLFIAGTTEGGVYYPQRLRWTGPGDPTDFISLNAGVADLLNDLGPIQHLVKLYQQGFAIQTFGITQIIPTGQLANPFQIQPVASNNKGCFFENSVAHQGGEFIIFAGIDNIYMFDGTYANPIGDSPLQGSRTRLGARSLIYADLQAAIPPSSVFAWISTNIHDNPFNAYWLVIPNVAVWVYNLDEGNWTRWTYGSKQISTVGRFVTGGTIRIEDLIGTIAQQTWSPITLAGARPFDDWLIGFFDGTSGLVDFSNYSEQPWSIASGQCVMGDLRHQKNVKKFRIVIQDLGQVQFSITVTGTIYPDPLAALDGNGQPISDNNNQVTVTKVVTMGTGSGNVIARVVDFNVPGQYIEWSVFGVAGVAASFVEFAPIYDIGGEQRGG